MLLFGLLFGRWWRIVIPIAVIGWPMLLITSGVDSDLGFEIDAGLLAGGNAVVGVLLNRLVARIARGALAS